MLSFAATCDLRARATLQPLVDCHFNISQHASNWSLTLRFASHHFAMPASTMKPLTSRAFFPPNTMRSLSEPVWPPVPVSTLVNAFSCRPWVSFPALRKLDHSAMPFSTTKPLASLDFFPFMRSLSLLGHRSSCLLSFNAVSCRSSSVRSTYPPYLAFQLLFLLFSS